MKILTFFATLLVTSFINFCFAQGGDGLTGTYYYTISFSDPRLFRVDRQVNFQTNNPTEHMSSTFSVRWEGSVLAPTTANYTFNFDVGGPIRVWVNGSEVLNKVAAGVYDTKAVRLTQGQKTAIKVEYRNIAALFKVSMKWKTPTTALALVPQSQLFSKLPNGILAVYYEYRSSSNTFGSVASRVETEVDFNWGIAPPHRAISTDYCFVSLRGDILPKSGQTYTFSVTTYNEDRVKVWINGNLIINKPSSTSGEGQTVETVGTPIALASNVKVPILIEYTELRGSAGIWLRWQSPGLGKQLVPGSNLFAVNKVVTTPPIQANARLATKDMDEKIVSEPSLNEVDINVFPNPTSDELVVDLHDFKDDKVVLTLSNETGNVLHRISVDNQLNKALNISELPQGIYFLSVESQRDPQKRITKRIRKL